tara:strand:+ start:129 stop:788 length:660 start_codon:yes stop_codon:yes gene_type:complete
MIINKDTLLFGSFSSKAGSVGCKLFNTSFQYHNINAIYKSFSIKNIKDAIISAKCLNFSGFAVSMPFKTEIIQYLDDFDDIVKKTNSCNTVLLKDNKLFGYNTDFMSIKSYLESMYNKDNSLLNLKFYILGNGSYSRTLQMCCKELDIHFEIITRENWNKIDSINDSIIFNCTPVENININKSNKFINCINTTETGNELAKKQASIQYKLYTGKDFPLN